MDIPQPWMQRASLLGRSSLEASLHSRLKVLAMTSANSMNLLALFNDNREVVTLFNDGSVDPQLGRAGVAFFCEDHGVQFSLTPSLH